jgi:hypothetical protein
LGSGMVGPARTPPPLTFPRPSPVGGWCGSAIRPPAVGAQRPQVARSTTLRLSPLARPGQRILGESWGRIWDHLFNKAVGKLTRREEGKGASFLAPPLDGSTSWTDITSIPNAGMTARLTEGMMAKSKKSKQTDRECTHRDRSCLCMALMGIRRATDPAQGPSVHPYQLTFRDIQKKR